YFVEALEAQTALQNLALRAFTAIQQEAVVTMHDDMRRQSPMNGGRR
ncbi:MAG: hypothetical protein H6660_16400, partial [Ardenticatenaceae bacterium]|nr:hypothetical protein [Ardenticatenaceae bacterium]